MRDYPGYLNLVALYAAIYRAYAFVMLRIEGECKNEMNQGLAIGVRSIRNPDGSEIDSDFQEYLTNRINIFTNAIVREVEISRVLNLKPFANPETCMISKTFLQSIERLWCDRKEQISDAERRLVIKKIAQTPIIYFNLFAQQGLKYVFT